MKNERMRILLKVIFGFIPVFMTYLAITTSMKSDMFHLSAQVLNESWFKATLVDFYFNITIISIWVIYKEKSFMIAILWIIAFICLGSIATAFYVFIQLISLKDSEGFEKVLLRKT